MATKTNVHPLVIHLSWASGFSVSIHRLRITVVMDYSHRWKNPLCRSQGQGHKVKIILQLVLVPPLCPLVGSRCLTACSFRRRNPVNIEQILH